MNLAEQFVMAEDILYGLTFNDKKKSDEPFTVVVCIPQAMENAIFHMSMKVYFQTKSMHVTMLHALHKSEIS